ncbi:carbohydrate kinase [Natrinema pellirubrum DSM 15624]|uniref:ADP-dependent (S)-NAD(P)H-hydrate dehydratase n=1 Tax=Natrinema pellirubrum (strain DSM 15624 / CIP 106293 / JCM 10476 / NCIMB 786 / 157) TaxID=797303 RepID=L0JI49_NATP1|nr:NAD(P)H-hydrate dehydratase [Natrinema pellirubrum]AGB30979.1 yjeF-like protein, hydroxyethylthiazole kinase-related protein [Natrinema pellirubrum DSM 15624]ELY80638.1 carbohydrate kinase [Natrinema pellirubrum DSM 15624]
MGRLQQTLSNVSDDTGRDNGCVGIVGGSVAYPNQPALAGRAALRTGSDHVRAVVPEPIYEVVAGHSPNLLVDRYGHDAFSDGAIERTLEMAEWADAVVIGPGLVDADPDAVREAVDRMETPTVVDALAIEPALEADLSNVILTPSDSEDDPIYEAYGSLEAFSEETGAVVTLTGGVDEIVAAGERIKNETGTSAMTVAGTGDTMAGITASLLGQGTDRREAAELGAWILGKTGELATAEYGPGVVATDVIERIPKAIR